MDWSALLDSLVPTLGEAGVKALSDELEGLAKDADTPWKKSILALVASGVEQFGPQGLELATDAVKKLIDGDDMPDIDWADLETSTAIVIELQNAEIDDKSKVTDFLDRMGMVLGQILGGFLRGLLG